MMEFTKPQPSRSTFVSVLAWIFIILAGFSTLISLLQNIVIHTFIPVEQMEKAMIQASARHQISDLAMFIFRHIQLLAGAFFVLSASTLIGAIGLLKRKDWARILFVCFLYLGIAWNIGSVVMQQFMFSSMPIPPNAPADFRAHFETMASVMRVVSILIALGLTVLYAWLIKRLMSDSIREEFA